MNINDQDIKVANYLKNQDIDYKVLFVAANHYNDDWQCDKWLVLFGTESFDYHTGIGHRIPSTKSSTWDYMRFDTATGRELKKLRSCLNVPKNEPVVFKAGTTKDNTFNRPKTTYDIRDTYAVKPTQAGVLYSLLLDMSAEDQTFKSWCDDYGYNTDSIKHRDLYLACQGIAGKVRKVFTQDQIDTLTELLQDY